MEDNFPTIEKIINRKKRTERDISELTVIILDSLLKNPEVLAADLKEDLKIQEYKKGSIKYTLRTLMEKSVITSRPNLLDMRQIYYRLSETYKNKGLEGYIANLVEKFEL